MQSDPHHYYATLDAIGLHIEEMGASDLLVAELDGGYALVCMVGDDQRSLALDDAGVEQLRLEAARTTKARRGGVRSYLRPLGQYLDERQARAVVLQERSAGYSVEYTGFDLGEYDMPELTRIHEEVSYKELEGGLSRRRTAKGR